MQGIIRILKPISLLLLLSSSLHAEEMSDATLRNETNLLWMCLAAFLVFFMQAGFSFVEAGFTRAKNAVNILMKNVSDFSVGGLAFFLFGFGIMFGPHIISGLGFGSPVPFSFFETTDGKPDPNSFGFFLFQMVFCGTAATISSGAMAERTRFHAYLLYSLLVSGFVYPVFGSLAWSNLFDGETEGLLVQMGFIDFAGSTVVHSVGGWLGLAGTIVLGPRLGKYRSDGKIIPIFGHNMSMAALGMFILWFGWYGFNPGSTVAVDGGAFAFVAVTTTLAACAGALGSMFLSWALFKRPDISMVINGALAGLVAITAPCYDVDPLASIVIGLVAGFIVVGGVILLDQMHIDDPVGAVSVHGFAGAWGTLSVGLFAHPAYGSGSRGLFYGGDWSLLGVQAIGVAIAFVWALGMGLLIAYLLKVTVGLRVSEEEEIEGLDILEHGNEAYPEQV
jgi:Amt family ammonium transporter